MPRRTLIDFHADLSALESEFVVYDDGYRSWSYSYAQVSRAAAAFAARLREAGIGKGAAVMIWSENRAEWLVALWGCLLEGVVLVPIDYRASADFLRRVAAIVSARVILTGDSVDAAALGAEPPAWRIAELRPADTTAVPPATPHQAEPEDTAEIIFTSGATAEPKGVVLTHRNILANIVPIEREMAKYRKWAKPFQPIRFLNLLPLSHMFGQAMATFIPPMLPGVVVFTRSYAPDDIIRQIRERRISVLVCVPKILEVLREHILRVAPEAANAPVTLHWMRRWWRFRRIHRRFGFKFWAMVVGAAPLDPELEAFWGRLGFLVVQGYGLTETAPIVTLNHPLHPSRGAVGKPIAGVEVRIAEDGEILMRGPHIFAGYWDNPQATAEALVDGWLLTGDLGTIDEDGYVSITGRKKDIIITAGGKNLTPANLENDLRQSPWVSQAIMHGDRRPYPVALITLDVEYVIPWAKEQGLSTELEQLAVHPLVQVAVQEAIDRTNSHHAKVSQIKKFVILDHDLSLESGDLTPTLKVKRAVVQQKYAALLDSLYAG